MASSKWKGTRETQWVPLDYNPCDPRMDDVSKNSIVVTWKRVQRFARDRGTATFLQGLYWTVCVVLALSLALAIGCGVVDVLFGTSASLIRTRQEGWAIQHQMCVNNTKLHAVLGDTCNQARAEVEASVDIDDHVWALAAHMKNHLLYLIPGYSLCDGYHPICGVVWLCFLGYGMVWIRLQLTAEKQAQFENRVEEQEVQHRRPRLPGAGHHHKNAGMLRQRAVLLSQDELDRLSQPHGTDADMLVLATPGADADSSSGELP